MILRNKQAKFAQMVALLILRADQLGYQVTLGDAYRGPHVAYGHKNSLHKKRLAIDLNLFKKNVYLTKTKDYEPLGIFWESIGGSWGGRFDDGNHFSLTHEGVF